MTPIETWEKAKAELAAVEAEREAAVAHLADRWRAAYEAEDQARDALPEMVGNCEGCGEPIFDGAPYHGDFDSSIFTCTACSPTWQNLADHPSDFFNPEADEPHTAASVKPDIDKHLSGGGRLSDSLAT